MRIVNRYEYVVAALLVFSLSGCQESSVKRDKPAPPVNQSFEPSGHIKPQQNVSKDVANSAAIPSTIQSSYPKLPPIGSSQSGYDNYSISAVNVPVTELLFKIAQDAGKNIDIYNGVGGTVTINALNQPLDTILNRMSMQAGFVYELSNSAITIKPDLPEWRNYKVDYVNVKKTSKESIDMKMSVTSGVAGTSSSRSSGTAASSTKVVAETVHDFWKKLEDNVKLLAQLDPNANQVLLPTEGKTMKKVELSSLSQNTVVNAEAGVISVYTTIKQHRAIKEYIDQVTTRTDRQVLIEATVVEVILNDQYQAGIDWTKFGGLSFTPDRRFSGTDVATAINASENILDNLKLLKTFGDSKVLSSPKIMAINNQTALLKVVENLVYFTIEVNTSSTETSSITTYQTEVNTIPVGFTMSVTPFVSESGLITLNVRPTITKQVGTVKDPNPSLTVLESEIPVIQEKEMSSVLKLRDRQTAIIGGLIEDSNAQNRVGIPWLSDVPVLGDALSLIHI